jgi:hypothetical protein
MGVIEVVDLDAGRRALIAGVLRCPCGGPLRRWGYARTRIVWDLGHARQQVRPDRAYCRSCGVTHVVLSIDLLPGRAYTLAVIGAALLGGAHGQGHRQLATRLQIPAATVRSWLRRARSNAEPLRRLGVQTVVTVEPELLPTRVQPTALGYAVEALTAAALAVVRLFGGDESALWPVICMITRGRLLAPTVSP